MIPNRQALVRGSILTGFREVLSARGIEANDLLAQAGIPHYAINDPAIELPLNRVADVLELAAERTDDPGFGLALAEAYPLGANGLIDYLMLHATTVRESLESLTQFAALLFNPSSLAFREEEDVAKLMWHSPIVATTRLVQFACFANAVLLLRLRRIAGQDWNPLALEVEHPELPCTARLHRIFGPRITFNARANVIAFDPATLKRTPGSADPRLYRILRETGEAKLQTLTSRFDVVSRTARAIVETLNVDPPLLENVAERMRISPRTLQNRLAQEGTSYERVLNDTRRNLAERYLRDSDLPLIEIAFRLGFSEQSAFTRAARGWFGKPPRQLRKLRQEGGWTTSSEEAQEP